MTDSGQAVLEVRGLRTWFHTRHGVAKAVDGVDLRVARGEVLGVVGESGCGKSVTALSIMRLVAPPGRVESGEILFEGRNLLDISDGEIANLRGDSISMIFQDPTSSLNPVVPVGHQISEVYEIHRRMKQALGTERVKRKEVTRGYWLRNFQPRLQIAEVVEAFDLHRVVRVFSRCMVCNHTLETVAEASIRDALPAGLRSRFERVSQCPGCGRLYWPGSHYDRLVDLVSDLISA